MKTDTTGAKYVCHDGGNGSITAVVHNMPDEYRYAQVVCSKTANADITVSDPLTLEEREMLLEEADARLIYAREDRISAGHHLRLGNIDIANSYVRLAESADLTARTLIERAMAGMPT